MNRFFAKPDRSQPASISLLLAALSFTALPVIVLTMPAAAQSSSPAPSSPGAAPESAPAAEQASLPIQVKAEQFVDLLFAHRYSEALAYVHPTLRTELEKEDGISSDVQDFQDLSGTFKGRLGAHVEDNLVLVDAEFANLTDTFVVIFDDQGQITGFDFPVEPLRAAHRQRILNN